MVLDLLLTDELKAKMPETIKIAFNFGQIQVVFPDPTEKFIEDELIGDSVVVEGDEQEIINWLKQFDGVAIGCGTPQLERFTIMHIDDKIR
jgi:hypothetical protein